MKTDYLNEGTMLRRRKMLRREKMVLMSWISPVGYWNYYYYY